MCAAPADHVRCGADHDEQRYTVPLPMYDLNTSFVRTIAASQTSRDNHVRRALDD